MSKIVERTLDLLELFADQRRPLSLSEISRLLKIPISSCHDVLQAMQARGYIYEISPRGGYYPTMRLKHMASVFADHDPVVQRAEIVLRTLRDELNESVLLAKVTGLQAVYLLALEPSHPLRFLNRVGDMVRSLNATSGGKALLGSLTPAALDAYLDSAELPRLTARTITSKPALKREITDGNAAGWFINRDESIDGVMTLSARFCWNATIYIVTIAGPTARLQAGLDHAARQLLASCKVLEM